MSAITENITVLPLSHFNTALLNTPASRKERTKRKRILMIEDDSDMSDLLKRALQSRFNCRIDVAQDPFEAINRMVDRFYDLIILDWRLPGLNGTETLAEAEKGLRYDPSVPIQWDNNRAPVVIFSSQKKSECLPRRTKHFNYMGYISKQQPLPEILAAFAPYIEDGAPGAEKESAAI